MYDNYENGECTIDQIGGHVIRFIILTQPLALGHIQKEGKVQEFGEGGGGEHQKSLTSTIQNVDNLEIRGGSPDVQFSSKFK